jgi:ankyrin repeat protein
MGRTKETAPKPSGISLRPDQLTGMSEQSIMKLAFRVREAILEGATEKAIKIFEGNNGPVRCRLINYTIEGQTMLMLAIAQGNEKVVEMMLTHPNIEFGAVNNDGATALVLAAKSGRANMVEGILLHIFVCSEIADNDDRTALTHAAIRNDIAMIDLLLRYGDSSITQRDRFGKTARDYLKEHNSREGLALLDAAVTG